MTKHSLEQVCRAHVGWGPWPHDAKQYPWAAEAAASCQGTDPISHCTACGERGDVVEGACNVGGVAITTWRKIEAMPCPENGDHWSCVMRPGAWEYFTPEAEDMRRALSRAGYIEEADFPQRPMGTRWVHRSQLRKLPAVTS